MLSTMPEGSCLDNIGRSILLDLLKDHEAVLTRRLEGVEGVYYAGVDHERELRHVRALITWVENVAPCTF